MYHLQSKFDLNPITEKTMISEIGALWRNFKGDLTREFIRPFINDLEKLKHPPKIYKKYITQKDWELFVKSRLTEKFQVQFILILHIIN